MSKPRRINSLSERRKFLHPARWTVEACLRCNETVVVAVTYSTGTRKYRVVNTLRVRYIKHAPDALYQFATDMQDQLLHDLYHSGVLRHGEQ